MAEPKTTLADQNAALNYLINQSKCNGFEFNSTNPAPTIFADQVFDREINPSGTVECETALRVGSTNNKLDLVLIANRANTQVFTAPAAATIEVVILTSETEGGTYTQEGLSYTVKAPTGGLTAAAGNSLLRVALGNHSKPWVKLKLTFTGAFTGGKLDAVLALMPYN